jgi:hypothetical protein
MWQRKPCQLNVRYGPAREMVRTCLDDAKTSKSAHVDAGTADIVVLHILKDCHSRLHVQIQVKELRSVQDCPAWIGGVRWASRPQERDLCTIPSLATFLFSGVPHWQAIEHSCRAYTCSNTEMCQQSQYDLIIPRCNNSLLMSRLHREGP